MQGAIVMLFFVLVLSGCGFMTPVAYTRLPTYTITPVKIVATTVVPHPNQTSTPISTPGAISTISLTETVDLTETVNFTMTVTPTLIPGALDCNMINSKHIPGITDLQWAEYIKTVIGKQNYFSGKVNNVEVNGVVDLIAPDQPCNFKLYNIPTKQAIKINKDDYIEGYGVISAIDFSDVVVIHLNVLLDSLIIR